MQFTQIFSNSSSVIIYKDSLSHEFFKGEEEYVRILNGWNEMVFDAVEMPAFGVSLDSLTREQMKEGEWIEFVFDGVCEFNEMPFEKLLVKVEDSYSGFNIVRYMTDGGYHGRCFYLQLNGKDMSEFSMLIKNIKI